MLLLTSFWEGNGGGSEVDDSRIESEYRENGKGAQSHNESLCCVRQETAAFVRLSPLVFERSVVDPVGDPCFDFRSRARVFFRSYSIVRFLPEDH